jgi:hypothetical protein
VNLLPANGRPHLVLHAGTHKTGSTAIQTFLSDHRDRLQAAGILYPLLDGDPLSHTSLQKHVGLAHTSGERQRLEQTLTELDQQLAGLAVEKVILSSEHFFAMPRAWVPTLLEALVPRFASVTLVIYLRSQRDLWISLANQRAKALKVLPTHRFWGSTDFLGPAIVENLHYADYLDAFARAIGSDQVRARLYAPASFPDESVVPDCLQAVGLEATFPAARRATAVNPSLGWKGFALAVTLASRHHALDTRRAVSRAMRKAFARAACEGLCDWLGSAPCFLSEAEQRSIRDTYAASNVRLADTYGQDFDAFLCERARPCEDRGLHDIDPAELREVNRFIQELMAGDPAARGET